MISFSLILSFYTFSDIKPHSLVNISNKNMTFSTLSYYLHVLLLLQHLRGLHFFLFCHSLLQKKNLFFYHIFALLYFFPSYISSLMAFFLVGFLSAYKVLYGHSTVLWCSSLLEFTIQCCTQPFHQISNLSIAHLIFS